MVIELINPVRRESRGLHYVSLFTLILIALVSCTSRNDRWSATALKCNGTWWSGCEITWSKGQEQVMTYLAAPNSEYEPKGRLVGTGYWESATAINCIKLWENGAVKDCSYSSPVGPWDQPGYPNGWNGPGSTPTTTTINDFPKSTRPIFMTTSTTHPPYSLILNDFRYGSFDIPIDPTREGYAFRFLLEGRERNSFSVKVFIDGIPLMASTISPNSTEFPGFQLLNPVSPCKTEACLLTGDFAIWVYLPSIIDNPQPESTHKIWAEISNDILMMTKSQKIELVYSATDSDGRPWGNGILRWRYVNKL